MIKVGDLVIKNTGGNKMKVISISNGIVECVWLTDSFNQDCFNVNELVPISEYSSLFKQDKRNDKIRLILDSITLK
jgi:uncharacterized protein YodC (DUF2158 family)